MAESNFVDYVKIYCRSGKGGRGSVHMHRAKYMPNGGPDGGNGGRGGHVILRGNRNYWTLLHLRYERHVFAGHGGNGSKDKSTGAQGDEPTELSAKRNADSHSQRKRSQRCYFRCFRKEACTPITQFSAICHQYIVGQTTSDLSGQRANKDLQCF